MREKVRNLLNSWQRGVVRDPDPFVFGVIGVPIILGGVVLLIKSTVTKFYTGYEFFLIAIGFFILALGIAVWNP